MQNHRGESTERFLTERRSASVAAAAAADGPSSARCWVCSAERMPAQQGRAGGPIWMRQPMIERKSRMKRSVGPDLVPDGKTCSA